MFRLVADITELNIDQVKLPVPMRENDDRFHGVHI